MFHCGPFGKMKKLYYPSLRMVVYDLRIDFAFDSDCVLRYLRVLLESSCQLGAYVS